MFDEVRALIRMALLLAVILGFTCYLLSKFPVRWYVDGTYGRLTLKQAVIVCSVLYVVFMALTIHHVLSPRESPSWMEPRYRHLEYLESLADNE